MDSGLAALLLPWAPTETLPSGKHGRRGPRDISDVRMQTERAVHVKGRRGRPRVYAILE